MHPLSDLDHRSLRNIFGAVPSGIAAIAATVAGCPIGMVVSTLTPVSLDPPLVSFCPQKSSATWKELVAAPRLGLSVLADHQEAFARQLSSKAAGDRFTGVDWTSDATGAVWLSQSVARFDCTLHAEFDAGDHTIAVLRILSAEHDATAAPIIFHSSRFRRLVAETA